MQSSCSACVWRYANKQALEPDFHSFTHYTTVCHILNKHCEQLPERLPPYLCHSGYNGCFLSCFPVTFQNKYKATDGVHKCVWNDDENFFSVCLLSFVKTSYTLVWFLCLLLLLIEEFHLETFNTFGILNYIYVVVKYH